MGSVKGTVGTQVPPGARVPVAWDWGQGEGDNNPVRLRGEGEALVLRAGTLPQPIRPCGADWPAHSLALIQSDPQADPDRRLAIRLLDSGTADQVLVRAHWQQDLEPFIGEDPLLDNNTRLLTILPAEPLSGGNGGDKRVGWAERSEAQHPASPNESIVGPPASAQTTGAGATFAMPQIAAWAQVVVTADYDRLAAWLDFHVTRELARAPVRVLASRGDMPWHGGPEQMPDERTGIAWVRVCPGTFTMGSEPGTDPRSREDERPAHPVALAALDIARTEATNGQFRRFRPDHGAGEADDLPAVNVRWQDARDICQDWLGGDLPTEAQWERAPAAAAWRPGPSAPTSSAWHSIPGTARATVEWRTRSRAKSRIPLGLYDMHGNVWERARDWCGPYAAGLRAGPDGTGGGESRVLRGGSYFNPPEDLRSGGRGGILPEVRRRFDGFRCVRVASPQR